MGKQDLSERSPRRLRAELRRQEKSRENRRRRRSSVSSVHKFQNLSRQDAPKRRRLSALLLFPPSANSAVVRAHTWIIPL